MLKFGAGFLVGFATLFVLILFFGDYNEPSAPAVEMAQAAPVPTNTPTTEPPPTFAPTETPLPTFTPVPTVTPTPLPTNTPVPVLLNQDLTLDGIRWRAVSVEEIGNVLHSDSEWQEDATTGGKFVRVTFNVESHRTEPDSGYSSPDLVDGQGRRFRAYEERFYYIPNEQSCFAETFNPNLPRVCVEIYAVAADSTGTYRAIVNNFDWIEPLEATIELR